MLRVTRQGEGSQGLSLMLTESTQDLKAGLLLPMGPGPGREELGPLKGGQESGLYGQETWGEPGCAP